MPENDIPFDSDKGPDLEFQAGEVIYRRVPNELFRGNQVLPHAFDWPAPSVLRSKYSKPPDSLHPNCCDGKALHAGRWVVAEIKVSDLPTPFETGDGGTMHFLILHRPEPKCYAHSEIRCRKDGDREGEFRPRPTGSLRELYLVELAKRAVIVYGPIDLVE